MFDRLEVLCSSDTDNLADLAELAAPGDAAFFNGAEFAGADLRCTDLSRFALVKATFIGAKIDDTTKMPDDMPLTSYDREDGSIRRAVDRIHEVIDVFFNNVNPLISTLQIKSNRNSVGGNINSPRLMRSNFFRFRSDYRLESNAAVMLASINKTILYSISRKNGFSPKELSDAIIRLEKIVNICDRFARSAESYTGMRKNDALPEDEFFSVEKRATYPAADVVSEADARHSVLESKFSIDIRKLLSSFVLYDVKYRNTETDGIWSDIRKQYIKVIKDLKALKSNVYVDKS